MGVSTSMGTAVWPSWRPIFRKIFDPKEEIWQAIFSGGIGYGKTTNSVYCLAYVMYKLMCLKSPQRFYGLQKNDKPGIAMFNITLDKAYTVGYYKLQAFLQTVNGPAKGRSVRTS
jgi:hypothetical protein